MKKRIKRFIISLIINISVSVSFLAGPVAGKEVDELLKSLSGKIMAEMKESEPEEGEDGELYK